MSYRAEWFHTSATAVTVEPEGTEIGDEEVDPGHVAVLLDADEGAVLYGPPAQVRAILRRTLATLDREYPEA